MIQALSLRNFKAHAATTIELKPFTVLVGPNAAGKTSILQAIELVARLGYRAAEDVLKGENSPGELLRTGAAGDIGVGVRTADGCTVQIDVAVHTREVDDPRFWEATAVCQRVGQPPRGHSAANGPFAVASGEDGTHIWDQIEVPAVYRFEGREIAAPSSSVLGPEVDETGANTAAVLGALKLADDPRYGAIVEALRRLVPSVIGVRIVPAPIQRRDGLVGGYQLVFDFQHATGIRAPAASEGTLVLLALLTAAHVVPQPGIILVDDIERGLHPTAQIELARQLAELTAARQVQIIATTHSPYILDSIEAANVLVFHARPDGSIDHKWLSEHPAAKRSEGTLSAGQLWSLDPESWIFDGSAA